MQLHKYRVLRDCTMGYRYYRADEVVEIDVEADGPPVYHFIPLDGGPVQEKKNRAQDNDRDIAKREALDHLRDPEPNTFLGQQQASKGGPVGGPSFRAGGGSPDGSIPRFKREATRPRP